MSTGSVKWTLCSERLVPEFYHDGAVFSEAIQTVMSGLQGSFLWKSFTTCTGDALLPLSTTKLIVLAGGVAIY